MAASPSDASPTPGSSSQLQEGDGVRKSGPIVLLNCTKKKGQSLYAVLSERALELHESEKAQRKKKGTKSIIDLSKCFNVSQQSCPKTRAPCVCLLMPDECFVFRADSAIETADWYSSLLFAVISARALHLGRPVFPNEFFECVWDVNVCPAQPKLKMPPQNPDNSPNICARMPHLAGRKRLCFYPHTIIICKVGIEPAHSGLPKSGIPPFRTTDFVEFSRHFIASYGSQEKCFLMRIGRSSPMGSCEVWIQCESEEAAAEVKNKLADIIRRETEKKQCALAALGNIAKGAQPSPGQHYSGNNGSSPCSSMRKAEGGVELETISEDEQLPQHRPISGSASSDGQVGRPPRKKHSSLSQSAKEKRLELRECKAKVDSLDDAEQRFQQQAAAMEAAENGWSLRRYNCGSGGYGGASSGSALCHSVSRPAYLGGTEGYLFRRRGSSNSMGRTDDGSARSKSVSLEQKNNNCAAWNNGRTAEKNNNRLGFPCTAAFNWMERTDSLNMLGASAAHFLYGSGAPEEETEDSGGTLRIPCEREDIDSKDNSRSASSLNLTNADKDEGGGHLVEAQIECHVTASGAESEQDGGSTEGEEDSKSKEQQRRRRKQQSKEKRGSASRQLNAESSQDAAEEADQSCCSSSVASSSSVIREEGKKAPTADEQGEYTFMDKVSCSSDSFSHLAVPPHCREEICSYTSDSGDSCYSSMVNGQLNPRAFSFSSTTTDPSSANSASRVGRVRGALEGGGGRHWTMGQMGMIHARSAVHHPQPHFSPSSNSNTTNLADSSSSRFSMETSLITPLEEDDERQVSFADEEQDKLNRDAQGQNGDDELRKRAFSLGSKSWITKPFRKLSSSHGNANTSVPHSHHHQQRNSGGGSRYGSSSLVGSMHTDGTAETHRLGSSSSFASSALIGHHTRSDSIGSSHSAALSLSGLSQRLLRKKQPSDEQLRNEDLFELEFLPGGGCPANLMVGGAALSANRSAQCVAILDGSSTRSPLRGRTSSCDEQNQHNKLQMLITPRGRGSAGALNHYNPQQQQAMFCWTPREQQSQQRLRPSESFIRSIQQQQQELQKARQQKQRQKARSSDFPLQEVQCFIAPSEREKIDAITASRDSLSMRSQRSGSGSQFETIQECTGTVSSPSQSRVSSSLGSSKIQTATTEEEDDYVLGESVVKVKA